MRIFCLLLLLCLALGLRAQSFVHIEEIVIEGNKKTKTGILLRELRFSVGDSIPVDALETYITQSEQLLLNTSLFNSVKITTEPCEACPPNRLTARVAVEEAWYLYPVPIFDLADRNFNVWWVEQNRSLNRINFGTDFSHTNITGRMDRLKIGAMYGYTQDYSFRYILPYINKKQTIGISTDVRFSRNREVNYATNGNKQLFHSDGNEFVYNRFRSILGVTYRPGLWSLHRFYVGYFQNSISDQVANELNPHFFLDSRDNQRYFSFAYEFAYDRRDIRPYPLNGNYVFVRLERDGLGVFEDRNALTLSAYYDHYHSFSPKMSLGVNIGGKMSFVRQQQPYNDNRALGFGRNYLHGYEYYIVDGLDMGFVRTNLRYQLLEKQITFGKIVPIEQFRRMPVKMYFSVNNDVGYVNDPFLGNGNFLVNQMLWGGGVGLDFVFFYDKVFKIEYSFNHLLESGIFFHINMNI